MDKVWQPVKFTLVESYRANRKLFFVYFAIQTVLALTYIIDLISYKEIIDALSHNPTIFNLSIFGILIFLLVYYLIYKVLDGISNYTWNLLECDQLVVLNSKFIDKLSSLDLSVFEKPQNVGLANRAFNRFQMQFKYYLKAIIDVYSSVIKLLISLSIFFLVSPLLAFIIIGANLVHIYINSRKTYGVFTIYRADDEIKRRMEYIVSTLFSKETLPEIKLYRAFSFFKDKLVRIYRQFTSHQLKVEKKRQIYNTSFGFLPTIAVFMYSWHIAGQAVNGEITSGQFIFLFFNSLSFNGTLFNLGQNLGHLHADSLFMKDAMEFFELKQNISFPVFSGEKKEEMVRKISRPSIKIENVSFKYPQGKGKVLRDVSLEIPFGGKIALIGDNGAGKTTLVKLLLRMYDPQEGRILLNGIDIKAIPEEELYRLYSTLFQSFGRFYFTIRENLEMAAGRKLEDNEIIDDLNFSDSWEFVRRTKDKLNQQLGTSSAEGVELSGGQWQRLAIARAYAKNSPILILDEPTSSVDAKSEMQIFDRLNREMKDNTLLFISHRFSTIKDAQRIVVLDKGKIIEDGTHEILMSKKGKYAKLYTMQAERYLRIKK